MGQKEHKAVVSEKKKEDEVIKSTVKRLKRMAIRLKKDMEKKLKKMHSKGKGKKNVKSLSIKEGPSQLVITNVNSF